AGALFHFKLLWAVLLGGICVAFLVEQAGRLAAVSGHTVAGAIRERFGYPYFFCLAVVVGVVTLTVLWAELGGVCVALEFVTGVGFRRWAAPVALMTWGLLWFGNFTVIERGASLLGLVTLCFVVGAWALAPRWPQVARGALCRRCRRTTRHATGSSSSASSARRTRRTSCSSTRPARWRTSGARTTSARIGSPPRSAWVRNADRRSSGRRGGDGLLPARCRRRALRRSPLDARRRVRALGPLAGGRFDRDRVSRCGARDQPRARLPRRAGAGLGVEQEPACGRRRALQRHLQRDRRRRGVPRRDGHRPAERDDLLDGAHRRDVAGRDRAPPLPPERPRIREAVRERRDQQRRRARDHHVDVGDRAGDDSAPDRGRRLTCVSSANVSTSSSSTATAARWGGSTASC